MKTKKMIILASVLLVVVLSGIAFNKFFLLPRASYYIYSPLADTLVKKYDGTCLSGCKPKPGDLGNDLYPYHIIQPSYYFPSLDRKELSYFKKHEYRTCYEDFSFCVYQNRLEFKKQSN